MLTATRSDTNIIFGNFNVKIGKEAIFRPTIVNYRLHNKRIRVIKIKEDSLFM